MTCSSLKAAGGADCVSCRSSWRVSTKMSHKRIFSLSRPPCLDERIHTEFLMRCGTQWVGPTESLPAGISLLLLLYFFDGLRWTSGLRHIVLIYVLQRKQILREPEVWRALRPDTQNDCHEWHSEGKGTPSNDDRMIGFYPSWANCWTDVWRLLAGVEAFLRVCSFLAGSYKIYFDRFSWNSNSKAAEFWSGSGFF